MDPKNFSEMQGDFIANSTYAVNIASGPIQCGKSYSTNVAFAFYVGFESPHTRFLICGNTVNTVHRNVVDNGFLELLQKIFGKTNVKYTFGEHIRIKHKQKGDIYIWIVGINNENAIKRLQGQPVGGALFDELTTYPEMPADMAFARNSLAGARVIATTNPESPNHWAYKKWVGNKEKQGLGMVKVWWFQLRDNPTLTEERITYYKSMFSGVFRERFIYGKWVAAEGAIYDMFLTSENTFYELPFKDDYDDAFVCIDYGTGSVTTFAVWKVKKIGWLRDPDGLGIDIPDNHYHLAKEWYYDSRTDGPRLTDPVMSDELKHFIGDEKPYGIFIDPSASSFITQLRADGFRNVYEAPNAVMDGINRISALLEQRRMKFHKDECPRTIEEYQGYVWDLRARERGDSIPLKKDDHCPDRDRYGIMGYEMYQIPIDSFIVSTTGGNILNKSGGVNIGRSTISPEWEFYN